MDLKTAMRGLNLHRPNRREFLIGAGAVAAAALALDVTAFERHRLTVVEQTVRIRRLPTSFHGMRIAQISDFHHHSFDEDYFLEKVVRRVNELNPTMVAMTGDFITMGSDPERRWRAAMPVCADILSGIKAPLRYCTLGNHDCADAPFVTHMLRSRGLAVIYNRYAGIELGGDRLWVGGIADAYYDLPDLDRAVPKDSAGSPVILLGHEPDFADTVDAYGGVDLMLAGHSHGGQVRMPGVTKFFLPYMGRKYVHGLFGLGDLQLYVNRGIGAVHLPVRFRCPPEITLFTLQPAQD